MADGGDGEAVRALQKTPRVEISGSDAYRHIRIDGGHFGEFSEDEIAEAVKAALEAESPNHRTL